MAHLHAGLPSTAPAPPAGLVAQAGGWFVGGRLVGSGSAVHWSPRPGRFVLERRSAEGTDRVVFEVSAAPPRRAVLGPNIKSIR